MSRPPFSAHPGACALVPALAALLALPAPSWADMAERASDALGAAQVMGSDDWTRETAEEVLAVPVETDHPQSDMDEGELRSQGFVAAADPHSREAAAYGTIGTGATAWTPSAVTGSTVLADQAHANPAAFANAGAFVAPPEADCTVTSFSEAPTFTRMCERTRAVTTPFCRDVARLDVIQIPGPITYACDALFTPDDVCDELGALPVCTIERVECIDAPGIVCWGEFHNARCSERLDARYDPWLIWTGGGVDTVELVWEETCSEEDITAPRCVETSRRCTRGPGILRDGEHSIRMDGCRRWRTEYQCGDRTYVSNCDVFEDDPGCTEVSQTCFSRDPDGRCGNWDVTYQCGTGEVSPPLEQCPDVNVCVHDVCQNVPRPRNNELPLALAHIDALNTMAEEAHDDPSFRAAALIGEGFSADHLRFFTPEELSCREGIIGSYDCCQDSGWALGWLASCEEEEVRLAGAKDNETTYYMGKRCTRKVFFVCVRKEREYCAYPSEIAKEISMQGQMLLHGAIECRGLTQGELERIDFSQIDLSPAFEEMMEGITEIDEAQLRAVLETNLNAIAPTVRGGYE